MRRGRLPSVFVPCFLLIACALSPAAAPPVAPRVTAVPEALRKTLKLDPFYQKYTDYNGLPILSSSKASDAASRGGQSPWPILA